MKKILAMALALCMVLAMVPATAMAEEVHTHCACAHAFTGLDADKCTDHNEAQTWTELDPANLPNSGYYYLTADLVLTTQWKITGDLHLCTNGFDVTAGLDESPANGWIRVDNGDTLTITNCKAQIANGKLVTTDPAKNSVFSGANGTGTFGAMFHANKDATLKLYGVEVSDNTTSSTHTGGWGAGAVLACDTGITVDIAYAAFCENSATATTGGALALRGGIANIRNTTFSGNTAATNGGAIYMCNSVEVQMSNCTFTSNEAVYNGGAVYVGGGSFTASGTAFTGNKTTGTTNSTAGGAALYLNSGTVTLTNATMTENENNGLHGSAITKNTGDLTLNSCTITGNNSKSNQNRAGIVVISNSGSTTVTGNTVITGNMNNSLEQNIFLRDTGSAATPKQPKLTVGALTSGAKMSIYTLSDLEPAAYLTATAQTPTFAANDEYLIYENRKDEADKTYGIGYNGSALLHHCLLALLINPFQTFLSHLQVVNIR